MTEPRCLPKATSSLLQLVVGILLTSCLTTEAAPISSNDAYVAWSLKHGSDYYDHESFFGNNSAIAIHWKIEEGNLHLAAAVETDGWLGFGFSEAGGMLGSDIVLFTAQDKSLVDTHALTNGMPTMDTCQDWTLVRYIVEPNFILFEAIRALSTGDAQDHEIVDDSDISAPAHRIIAAWGDSGRLTYHGDNRATALVRFFGTDDSLGLQEEDNLSANARIDEDLRSVEIRADGYLIPEEETTYENFCFGLSDFSDQGFPQDLDVHVVQADFIPDPSTSGLVHHIILYASRSSNACDTFDIQPIYLWAPGTDTFHTPRDVGVRLGGLGYSSIKMEVHYDNRDRVANKVDNSGVRLVYTSTLRQHDAGVFSVGDPLVEMLDQRVGDGIRQYDFPCPSSCTQAHFQDKVTVFQEVLHMHEVGVRMTNQQLRDGTVVREGKVDYYDFRMAGAFTPIQDPFDLRPGDELKTTCYYENAGKRMFGLGSEEEMCIAYLWYYPEISNFHGHCGYGMTTLDQNCAATYENKTVAGEEGLNRSFGHSTGECSDDSSLGPALGDSEGGSSHDTVVDIMLDDETASGAPGIFSHGMMNVALAILSLLLLASN